MTNFLLKEYDTASSTEKYKNTNTMDPNFLSLAINGLPVVNTGGAIDVGAVIVTNLSNGVGASDAVVVGQVMLLSGANPMAAALAMGGNKITGMAAATANGDAVRFEQAILVGGGNAFTGDQSMGSHKLTNLANGTSTNDAVNFGQLSAVAGGAVTLPQNEILVGNASNVSAAVAMSGEATIVASGAVTLSNAAVIGKLLTAYAAAAGTVSASDSILSAIQKIDGNDALKIPLTQKGANSGVATLDSGGKIPLSQLPASLMEYQGTYNATTNTPALADGTGTSGFFYRVNVAGTQNFGSGSQTFVVGDWVMYNGTIWQLAHSGADAVQTVNGQAGTVVLTTDNISEGVTNLYYTNNRAEDAVGGIVANSSKINLTYVSHTSITATIVAGSLVNADINAAAAIAYSKLALTGSIVNADINAAAAIAYSKLALTNSIVNGDISSSAAIAYSKLNLTGSILNADINASAAIVYSKLALSNSIAASDLTTGVFDQSTIVGGNGTAGSVRFYDTFTNDNAGAITVGQVVYIKSNGHVDLAAQNTSNLSLGALGVVMDASIASGASGKIIVRRGAVISGYSSLTPGKKEYVSTTAGALSESLTSTSGNYAYSVGRAETATVLIFDPQFEFQFA